MADQKIQAALGKLKLGASRDELARAMGDAWEEPTDKGNVSLKRYKEGALGPEYLVMADITTDHRIGRLGFYGVFSETIDVLGLALGTAAAQVFDNLPPCRLEDTGSSPEHGPEAWRCDLGNGAIALAMIRNDQHAEMERLGPF
jgi:hypothetical protein